MGLEAPAASLPDWARQPAVRAILRALRKAGGEGRFVGGCVRDHLVGRAIEDIDIATALPPQAVMTALRNAGLGAAPSGIAHGTVTAIAGRKPYEITTLRQDIETFGRHARVAFTGDWSLDARRRDLTMNALYLDAAGGLHDYAGGLADLKAGRVRFIGDPRQRIEEDYLRILRFLRFHAHYARRPMDEAGLEAAAALAPGLRRISAERKRRELLRLLAAADPLPVLHVMAARGIFTEVLAQAPDLGVLRRLLACAPDSGPLLRLAALLPAEEGAAIAAARALKLSGKQEGRLRQLARAGAEAASLATQRGRREGLYRAGPEPLHELACLATARRCLAAEDLAALGQEAQAWQPKTLPVGGRDLLRLGLQSGPELGAALRALERWWIDRDFTPDRQALLAEAERRLST